MIKGLKRIIAVASILCAIAGCEQKLPDYPSVHPGSGNTGKPSKPDTPKDDFTKPDLGYDVSPYSSQTHIDTYLTLEFPSEVAIGNTGAIKIFKKDGTQVDVIKIEDVVASAGRMENNSTYTTAMDAIGSRKLGRYRIVNYKPVEISGKKVIIRPHSNSLSYDTEYYVTIDKDALVSDKFSEIPEKTWRFATKCAPESKSEVTVSKDGKGDFTTIQAALDYSYDCGQNNAMTINVKNGTYEEQLFMRSNNKVTIKGESRDGVVLQYSNCDELASGTGGSTSNLPSEGQSIRQSGGRAVILLENCNLIRFEDMTLINTYSGPRKQAEVIYNNDNAGTGKIVFVNCRLVSRQDTICTKGYNWFYGCTIEGDVDFIWGSAETALFENCEIMATGSGYITQARCFKKEAKGFVFLDCTIGKVADVPDGGMYLARSSGAEEYFDNVTFVKCRMSSVVNSAGWYVKPAPNPAKATADSGWKEYGSMDANGSALSVSSRASAGRILTDSEYERGYKDRNTIFSGCPSGTDWLTE